MPDNFIRRCFMQQTMIPNSGIMTVPQIAAPQLVYLDFDGELASYNGELLTIDRVEVEDSGLTEPQIARIVSGLNEEFEGQNIVFTAEKPASGEYSTVFIGGTSAFEPFGSFAGLAETVDTGNAVRNDNAFVILKGGESIEAIIDTIAHETQHLIGTLDHGGEGLGRYAWVETLSLSNVSSSGLNIGQDSGNDAGYVSGYNATLVSATVNSGGCLNCSRGQLTSTVVNSSGVVHLSSGSATAATVNGGSFHLRQATLVSATVSNGGILTLLTGSVSSATVNSASIMVSGSSSYLKDIKVVNGGTIYVADVGTQIENCSVSGSGRVDVYHTYLNTFSAADGTIVTFRGGSATDITLNNARMYISSGGGVCGLTITSGGYASVQGRGSVSSGTVYSSSYILNSGGELKAIRLSGGRIHCAYDGQATNITGVNASLSMENGGKILSAAIGGSADFKIRNSGIASSMTSYLSARMAVSGGGSAVNTTLNSATVFVLSDGCIRNLSMSRGIMYLSGGAILSGSIVNGGKLVTGGLVNAFGATYTMNLAGYTGKEVTEALVDNYANLASVSYAVRVASDQQSGLYRLLGNASAFNQSITLNVAGVTASPGTLSVGTSLETWSHRYALTRTGSTVALQVTMNDLPVKIYSGGVMVSGGKTISSKTISGSGAVMRISSGGVATDAKVSGSGAVIHISSGGVATAATVRADGMIFISGGGIASGITAYGGYVENFGGVMTDFSQYDGFSLIGEGGSVRGLTVVEGQVAFGSGGTVGGNILIHGGSLSVGSGTTIDFSVADATPSGGTLLNNWALIDGRDAADYTLTVKAGQADGTYTLAGGAGSFNRTLTVQSSTGERLGSLSVSESLKAGKTTYSLTKSGDNLLLGVSTESTKARGDLDGNGISDLLMTITLPTHPHVGATGAWLIQDNHTAAWGDLSTRNSGWSLFGMGKTAAGKATDDVYIVSSDNIIGAWVTGNDGKVSGWETVGSFDDKTQILGLGDFNGNGQSDVLLRNSNGAVGCYFTSGSSAGWNYFQSLGNEWSLAAIGDFNGDGIDDVVLKHDAGFAGCWLIQEDGTAAWSDLDTLKDGFEIAGAGDFNGDGIDDVLLRSGSYYGSWLVENGNAAGWMGLGTLSDGTELEQIGDYNGDGVDDLRIRTANGDLGAQLVMGADSLNWKYYGSVGSEWSTSLASL